MAQIKTKQIKDAQSFSNITPASTSLNDILAAIDTQFGLTGGIPRVEYFETPTAGPVTADTVIVTLANTPLTSGSPNMVDVNGAGQNVGTAKDVSINGTSGAVTWLGSQGTGTGTAEFAIEIDDLVAVSYESVS
jgi:hypothetical protein